MAKWPDFSTWENNNVSYDCICDMVHKKPENGNNVCKDVDECASDDVLHMIAIQKLIALKPMVLSHVPVKQNSMTSMVTAVFVNKLMSVLMK